MNVAEAWPFIAGTITICLGIGTAFWRLNAKIDKTKDDCLASVSRLRQEVDGSEGKIHDRINDGGEKFARKHDLTEMEARIERGQERLLEEFKDLAQSVRHRMSAVEQEQVALKTRQELQGWPVLATRRD